ncbi:MAG: nucleotidyl transferase AbiEii/AbiGii toxin family protein [Bacteroidetes bacterium]|nr:nucleotidyl transferase AbiEii/AbiGii toxin family protein [Bacteroidota bacterium]
MKNNSYHRQAELLLRVLPIISKSERFALKGGTAINFFFRNMPRLSVDIDLVFLPLLEREESLRSISDELLIIKERILKLLPNARVVDRGTKNSSNLSGLLVSLGDATIKIEVNTIIRGSVFDPVEVQLCKKAEEVFELTMATQTLSFEDLYAGKICAALDRQHPRDLFDIKLLQENEGISEKTRKAFIVYLLSHNRPIAEMLNPNKLDIASPYNLEFSGMTEEAVTLEELIAVREKLISKLNSSLTSKEKEFILSFKMGTPDWDLFEIQHTRDLPSVKWKLENINRMIEKTHMTAYNKLLKLFELC